MDDLDREIAKALEGDEKPLSPAEQRLYDKLEERILRRMLREKRDAAPKPVEKPPAVFRPFTPDLPPYVGMIMLDGVRYLHGFTYSVREDKIPSLLEIQGRTWNHENEVRGARPAFDSYRRNQPVVLKATDYTV